MDPKETELMVYCERNKPISTNEEFLKKCKTLRLGNFYYNKKYILKIRNKSLREGYLNFNPPELIKAILELNNTCNRDCWFCGYYGVKRSAGCLGCNKWKENGDELDTQRWKEIIDQLIDLNCPTIHIKGGDLTLSWDKTLDVLDYAMEKFENIYITIHQKSASKEILEDLTKRNCKIIIQTQDPNDLQFTDATYLLTLVPEDNKRLFRNIKTKNDTVDFLIDGINTLKISKPTVLMSVDLTSFCHNIKYHPCLGCIISITFDGRVLPCPMMRDRSFGNLKSEQVYSIFGNKWEEINKFWTMNLDNIDKCKDCEFRYACADCRALEESLTGKVDGKVTCSYDSLEGKWS